MLAFLIAATFVVSRGFHVSERPENLEEDEEETCAADGCQENSCDYWAMQGYDCAKLIAENDCNCKGCSKCNDGSPAAQSEVTGGGDGGSCPKTCQDGHDCNYWRGHDYACALLEQQYSCDCSGCSDCEDVKPASSPVKPASSPVKPASSPVKPASKSKPTETTSETIAEGLCPVTCNGQNCDYWTKIDPDYNCAFLESSHACDCTGCSTCTDAPAEPQSVPTSPAESESASAAPEMVSFIKASNEQMTVVAQQGFSPVLLSNFQCASENRASCQSVDAVDAPCVRGKKCELGLYKEKHGGPWMNCCQKFCYFETLAWMANAFGEIDTDGNKFWWSIISGTLLGSMRNKNIIDWTSDVDIIVPKEFENEVVEKLRAAIALADPVYKFKLTESDAQKDVRRISLGNTCTAVDIFIAHGFHDDDVNKAVDVHNNKKDKRGVYGMSMLLPNSHVPTKAELDEGKGPPCVKFWEYAIPSQWIFPLQQCEIQGSSFPCINDAEEYVKFIYGDQWKEPDAQKPKKTVANCGSGSAAAVAGLFQMPDGNWTGLGL